MKRRVIELEPEVADWAEQLVAAEFGIAAFALNQIAALGALRAGPRVRRIGGERDPLQVMRLYPKTEPAGLVYWCAPGHRTVLLTVWRTARISETHEAERARGALRDCARHTPFDHRRWTDVWGRRITEPGAAEMYQQAALAHAFGQHVHHLRRLRRLSTADLAALADTTGPLVERCECGGLMTTTPAAERIATALGCRHLLDRLPPPVPMPGVNDDAFDDAAWPPPVHPDTERAQHQAPRRRRLLPRRGARDRRAIRP
ncbi:MAG TPA: hypothetical protein VHJ17_10625 [Thermomonospora sp.]|nr:hypothetical protein [Thermomonospora sp.]